MHTNTPTPILNQKHASFLKNKQMLIKNLQIDNDNLEYRRKLIVPNTPCVSSTNGPTNSSKVFGKKKLLDINGGYFAADNLPGEGLKS